MQKQSPEAAVGAAPIKPQGMDWLSHLFPGVSLGADDLHVWTGIATWLDMLEKRRYDAEAEHSQVEHAIGHGDAPQENDAPMGGDSPSVPSTPRGSNVGGDHLPTEQERAAEDAVVANAMAAIGGVNTAAWPPAASQPAASSAATAPKAPSSVSVAKVPGVHPSGNIGLFPAPPPPRDGSIPQGSPPDANAVAQSLKAAFDAGGSTGLRRQMAEISNRETALGQAEVKQPRQQYDGNDPYG